jgi:hypothetical protein
MRSVSVGLRIAGHLGVEQTRTLYSGRESTDRALVVEEDNVM